MGLPPSTGTPSCQPPDLEFRHKHYITESLRLIDLSGLKNQIVYGTVTGGYHIDLLAMHTGPRLEYMQQMNAYSP
jgi:hypothetical protein